MKTKYRKGFYKEIAEIFDLADEMCGSFHPDNIQQAKDEVQKLHKELVTILKSK